MFGMREGGKSVFTGVEGTVFVHHSGREYVLLCMSNLEDTEKFPCTAVYLSKENGRIYSRPLEDFNKSFTAKMR